MFSNSFFDNLNNCIQKAPGQTCWQKLTDYCGKMSVEQQLYINQQPEVVALRNELMEAFSLFLFEKFKNEFGEVETFKQLCNNYIDTVISIGQGFSKNVTNILDENKVLKERIAELEGRTNEQ